MSEEVVGSKGVCDVSGHAIRQGTPAEVQEMAAHRKSTWHFTTKGAKDPYQQEHDDLFAAIRNDTPYSELESGAYSSMTAVMGRMATYSGKEVTWEQALNSQIDTMPKALSWDAAPPTLPDKDGHYAIAIPGVTVAV